MDRTDNKGSGEERRAKKHHEAEDKNNGSDDDKHPQGGSNGTVRNDSDEINASDVGGLNWNANIGDIVNLDDGISSVGDTVKTLYFLSNGRRAEQ